MVYIRKQIKPLKSSPRILGRSNIEGDYESRNSKNHKVKRIPYRWMYSDFRIMRSYSRFGDFYTIYRRGRLNDYNPEFSKFIFYDKTFINTKKFND